MINRLRHLFVWLSRIHCCRGFGIQSPTDYAFVRYVINEHWPYYAYETMGTHDEWLRRKLGFLYFRMANWRQPGVIIDRVGAAFYLQEGCHKARIVDGTAGERVELAVVPMNDDVNGLLTRCDDRSVVVVQGLYRDRKRWEQWKTDERVTVSYNLYYCGVLLFDRKRYKQQYKINF